MLFSTKSRLERYFRKNPQVKTIVVVGSYGRKSAIRALGMILGQQFTVTMGVNKKADADAVILDYKSSADFPNRIPTYILTATNYQPTFISKIMTLRLRDTKVILLMRNATVCM